jgi:3-phenylpropionate/trans-cinnamate dioxygenase ferredoxin reductase subunit
MSPVRKIVIIGGGPAAVGAAIAARQQDPAAEITFVTEEAGEPYEKPPLSKAVLTGKVLPTDAPIAGPGGLAAYRVNLKAGAACREINRTARVVITDTDEHIPYDALILATGAVNRVLPMFPPGQAGIYYLRTQAEALALKARLEIAKALVVIGGGLIGLEVAASAAELNIATTVIEIAPRIMARVCDPESSAFIHEQHRTHGVNIRTSTAVERLETTQGGQLALNTNAGDTLLADLIVVGAGAKPNDRLAHAAGLEVEDGIVVDDHCRTPDPSVFAAGDCTRFPGPHGAVRLENWRHAQEQGAVAGRNAAGGDVRYDVAPSFWSEQYDLYIQGVGWRLPASTEPIRRPVGARATILFWLEDSRIVYVLGINAQRDIGAARRLIERQIPVNASELGDPSKALAAMLKTKS